MQRFVIIFSLLLSLVLLTTAEQKSVTPAAPTEDQLARAKAAYNRWLESGTATAEEQTLLKEYLRFTSPMDEKDGGGNPLTQQGGPDSSGYRYVDNQPPDTAQFLWIELCADPQAQNGPQGDNALQVITFPTPFPFYGLNNNAASISTNGAIGFGANAPGPTNSCEPRATASGRFIYVYWDDLNAATVGGCNGNGTAPWIRWRDFGDKVVIEWKQIKHLTDNGQRVEAEAILYPDGRIKLQYNLSHTADGASATIGIERPGTSNGLGNGVEYSCNLGRPLAGRAIWFYNPSTSDLLTENLVPCGSFPPGPQQVSVRVRNAGLQSAAPSHARYRFDGVDSAPFSVPPLAPASFFDVFFSVPINVTVGPHTLMAFVGNVDPSPGNDTTSCAALCGSPANDGCENAVLLVPPSPGSPRTVTGSTTCASISCSESGIDCDYASNGPDMFYSLMLNTCRRIDMNLTGGDMHLSIYAQGQCCVQPPLLCNDDHANFTPPSWADPAHLPAGSLESYIAAELNPGVYFIRVGRYSAGSGAFTLTVFDNGPCPSPCGGTLAVSQNPVTFPATYVGEASTQMIQVSNNGTSPLCVSNVTSSGDVWTVWPSAFTLNPGGSQALTITFQPVVSHLFNGELGIISSDPEHPRTDILVSGRGCNQFNPNVPLPLPELFNAGTPSAIYFGFSDGGPGYTPLMGDWAVEVSTNDFATGLFLQPLGGLDAAAAFLSPEGWESYGFGVINGLEPLTTYQVRFRLRDCTGVETPGPSASFTTDPPIVMRPLNTTLRLLNATTLELNWDSVVRDTADRPLQNEGFEIYHQPSLIVEPEFIMLSLTGVYSFPLPPDPQGFYQVQPLVNPIYLGPRPVIAWPPENATLSGLNTVVIHDYYHLSEWDSFRVEMDGPNGTVLLGSSFNNPWTESDQRMATADFSIYGSGPHTITVTVVPHVGSPITLVRHVNVIQPPHCEFTASYDPGTSMFNLTPANLQNVNGPVLDYYWQTSQFGDFWGPSIQFHWDPAINDSLTVVSVYPYTPAVYLTDEEPQYLNPAEAGGVVPETVTTTIFWFRIECCCDNLELRTTGTADGTYYDRAGNATQNYPLGPQLSCDPATNQAHVGFAFEVVLTYKYKIGDVPWVFCSSGQDCKRTDNDEIGTCAGGVFTATKILPPDHKNVGGVDYPANGPNYGNDDYRPNKHGGTYDPKTTPGKIRWIDIPHADFTLKNNKAIHSTRIAHFVARADPQCQPVNIICCRSWDLNWDVVFCQNCSQIIPTTPPAITNEQTPANCPALAL